MSRDFAREWIEKSPYAEALGVRIDDLSESTARLSLPFKDENANPGRALHGGVAASLAVLGAQAVARAALGPPAGPWHTAGVQVSYLAAAVGEPVLAEATRLRKGKELCFVEVDVRTAAGKAIAHASASVRGRFGAPAASPPSTRGDDGAADPGPMGPHVARLPFVSGRGIQVQNMTAGCSRLVMPFREANTDAEGRVHEGALLALLDTTGAMAAWAETGPGAYKASTVSLQAQILEAPSQADLVAYGRVTYRDAEIFLCDVEVATAPGASVAARGTVIYRIVV